MYVLVRRAWSSEYITTSGGSIRCCVKQRGVPSMPQLRLWCRKAQTHDPYIARLVACVTLDADCPPVCHVELAVPVACDTRTGRCQWCAPPQQQPEQKRQTAPHYLSFSVTMMPTRDRVFFTHNRNYPPLEWDMVPIEATVEQVQRVHEFLQLQMDKPFHTCALWLHLVPCVLSSCCLPVTRSDQEQWFCSELCCAALREAEILPSTVVPLLTSPVRLYALMRSYTPPEPTSRSHQPTASTANHTQQQQQQHTTSSTSKHTHQQPPPHKPSNAPSSPNHTQSQYKRPVDNTNHERAQLLAPTAVPTRPGASSWAAALPMGGYLELSRPNTSGWRKVTIDNL
jgi:hypothetical protein